MTCDHRLGYEPATRENWSGLECDWFTYGWGEAVADACAQEKCPAPRRWIGLTCMTKADQDARQHDVQAGRLGLPMFHVEQPGTLVYCGSDMISGMQGKALSAALERLREAAAVIAHDPDWNDG
jgi:hypothetical protein